MENNSTILVGMSGGVDSSVSALLLKKQGHRVVGLHMMGENLETNLADAQRVKDLCQQMDIECHIVEYRDQMQTVKDYFISEYKAGRTPNPCVVCNKNVKFNPFLEYLKEIGADYFATGHYAQIEHIDDKHYLKKAIDNTKDQTYFLCMLSQKQLKNATFALGNLTKDQVREIAKQNNLISAETKDSYDICFLGSQKFKDYMANICLEKPGNIVDIATNKVVGKHIGISKYTIGQRKGLGIGGGHGQTGEGWFVVDKDVKTNTIYVSQGDGQELLSSGLVSGKFNWIPQIPKEKEFDCYAKVRYRQPDQKVHVTINQDGTITCHFYQKQRAITIGQFVVLYGTKEGHCEEAEQAQYCLGGAVIESVIK